MLLSITNRTPNATDLGYLLHKHPQHGHDVKLGYGNAKVFYTKAEEGECTAVCVLTSLGRVTRMILSVALR